ncbi:MAG: hypothetical protein CMM42_15425 [Rhodospirillaceae bacterium]|nr:hypothetical protein [Rhodospirillaceae bacterium]
MPRKSQGRRDATGARSGLSTIMSAFIDAAWGVHPAQLSKRARGKKSLCQPSQCAKIGTNPKQNDAKGPAASLTEE